MTTTRLGFLGAGSMSSALIHGLLRVGTAPERMTASDVDGERLAALAAHGVRTTRDNRALLAACDVLVLAVKPQSIAAVLDEIGPALAADQLVVSIAAGVPIAALQSRLPAGTRIVRAMPNTPATIGRGATAVAAGPHATEGDLSAARSLFEAVGLVVSLDEVHLDAVTGLSGSGPAYVLLVIEALADGGVKAGLTRDTAVVLAAQTVLGSAQLLLQTGEHPAKLRDRVTSPGGTTIAGIHALERGGVRAALIDAVELATRRSAELGRAMTERMAATSR